MAKRISRREFQEGLSQRLSQAALGEASQAWLGVLAGGDHWLFELADAGEIVPMPQLTEVPLTKPWFSGMVNIRGTLYSVVDFSAFQGGEATPRSSASRLLLVGVRHGINSALLVSQTLGLKNPDSLEAYADPAPDTRPWAGECYRDQKGQQWHKMLIKPLITHPDFLDVGL
jgi:twitching motility protein PilI